MGGIYLRAQGHPHANVPEAVRWHYHPISIEEGSVPAHVFSGGDATVFGAVSIADKLDTLVGYFGLGLMPTGSSDPFGLRRAAQGVVRVLLDFWHVSDDEKRPNLGELIRLSVAGYEGLKRPSNDVVRELEGFFLTRLESVFEARGFAPDEVAAAIHTRDPQVSAVFDNGLASIRALTDVYDCYVRLRALHSVRLEAPETFGQLASAFKRANSLLEQAATKGNATFSSDGLVPEPESLTEPAERELLGALLATRNFASHTSYEERLRSMAAIRPAVDRFFDQVMVMVDDKDTRQRRLELLHFAVAPINRIADISKLGG
jgi:glycyl-tRNA synthetase beta chain